MNSDDDLDDDLDDDFVYETSICDCCGIEFPVLVFNHPETGSVQDEYNLCDCCLEDMS